MIPLVVIRPQPGCDATVAAARAMGLPARAFPLFAVHACAWELPDPADFDALLIGSANAIRLAAKELAGLRHLPVLAVGETTAQVARDAGFTVAETGAGGMQALLCGLGARYPRLLRLSGRERIALVAPAGVTIAERTVYASESLAMPDGLREVLAGNCVVALHSAGAARRFAQVCDASGIDHAGIALAALGPRIAQAAGEGWSDVRSATSADDPALLALAAGMCQTGGEKPVPGSDKRSP